jgi:hypothetical protein
LHFEQATLSAAVMLEAGCGGAVLIFMICVKFSGAALRLD